MFFCGTGIAGYKYTADLTHVIVDDADTLVIGMAHLTSFM